VAHSRGWRSRPLIPSDPVRRTATASAPEARAARHHGPVQALRRLCRRILIATGTRRDHRELTRIGTSAVAAVVTVVVLGAGAIRARSASPAEALAAALTTTTYTRAPTLVSTTTATHPREPPSTRPRTSTTTTVAPVAAQ